MNGHQFELPSQILQPLANISGSACPYWYVLENVVRILVNLGYVFRLFPDWYVFGYVLVRIGMLTAVRIGTYLVADTYWYVLAHIFVVRIGT